MGSIYKRGRIYWIKFSNNGKPEFESSKSTKRSVARRLLNKREGEVADGKRPGSYFDRVKFDELCEDYLTECRINSLKALDRAELSVKHLKDTFGGLRVPSISTARINAYKAKRLAEGKATGTVNRELSALKRILRLGAQCTPPKVDRVPHITMLKENKPRSGFFEHEEFLELHKHLPEYLQPLCTFAYKVGWRRGEITTLKWTQVDLKEGVVTLEPGTTKNDEGRVVYLDAEMLGIFRKLYNSRRRLKSGLPWVFLNEHGTDRVIRFYKAWNTACKKAGLDGRLFHDFRRTAVRNMVRAGIPEAVAMKISGHKTRSVFERYNIVDDTDLRLAAQRQADYLESQKVTKSVTLQQ